MRETTHFSAKTMSPRCFHMLIKNNNNSNNNQHQQENKVALGKLDLMPSF